MNTATSTSSAFTRAARRAVTTGGGVLLVALVAIGGVTGCSSRLSTSGSGADTSSTSPATPAEATASETAPAEAAEPGIGAVVKAGDLEFTITGVEEIGGQVGSEYLNQTAQGRFVGVGIKVTNVGSKATTFFSDYVQLVDSADRTFDSDSTATIYAAPSADAWISEINPGNSFEGKVVFDLPADATPAVAIVKDNAFLGGERIRLQ